MDALKHVRVRKLQNRILHGIFEIICTVVLLRPEAMDKIHNLAPEVHQLPVGKGVLPKAQVLHGL